MKEQLITFETAKLAKEKGFKIRHGINECVNSWFTANGEENGIGHTIARPTQSLLQKGLRERHNTEIWFQDWEEKGYGFDITNKTRVLFTSEGSFKTYELALEKALFEALKLIPKK